MSLLETLKAVKNEGFDPKKDKINDNGLLGAGKYPVRLMTAEHNVQPSTDREQLIITLEVTTGGSTGRQEKLFLGFDEDLPKFVLEKNSKILLSIGEFANIIFSESDLTNLSTTADAVRRGIGNQFLMDLKIAPNKKNPDYPYRNYEFDQLQSQTDNQLDVGEMDIPF